MPDATSEPRRDLTTATRFASRVLKPSRGWLVPTVSKYWPATILVILACLTTFRLAWLTSTYPLTLAPFSCVALLMTFGKGVKLPPAAIAGILILLLYPWIALVFTVASPQQISSGFDVDAGKFWSSYALWAANGLLLIFAFVLTLKFNRELLERFLLWSLVVMVSFGVAQSLLMNLLGNSALYNLFHSEGYLTHGGDTPIILFYKNGLYRAPGFFYEPSFFGRWCVCLLAAYLLVGRRPFLSIGVSAAGVVASLSAGAMIFWAVIVIFWLLGFRERPRKTSLALVTIGGALFLMAPLIAIYSLARFNEMGSSQYNSGNVRLVLPWVIIRDTLATVPLGAPIGTNSMLAATNSEFRAMAGDEMRVTNGVYELFIYTGITGLAGFAVIVGAIATNAVTLAWRRAMLLTIIAFATVVSSSFLAFESTVSMIPVIIAYKFARRGGQRE